MQLDDVVSLSVVRILAFPKRYDVRVQIDDSCASIYIEGGPDEAAESVIERALVAAYGAKAYFAINTHLPEERV